MTAQFDVERYVRTLKFAALRHAGQSMPSSQPGVELPYLVHVTSVTAEVIAALPGSELDADLAVGCALLHDTIEDTDTKPEVVERAFGPAVAAGVAALSKNGALPKAERMADALARIRLQPREEWMVKLADRVVKRVASLS